MAGAAPLVGSAGARPNLLILHCHDLGQFLHCYGVKTVRTPNVDALAAGGVLFERSFCTAPQCSPSRASIFTGRYPHSNGVMGLTHADFAWDLEPGEKHLGEILKGAGYATAGVGVIHETRSGAKRIGLEDYVPSSRARAMADAAIERLERFSRTPEQPFYMQAGCVEPHRLASRDPAAEYMGFVDAEVRPDSSAGVTVPPYLRDTPGTRAEIAELQGAVRHMDEQMGRVLDAVARLGLERNTLVVFTADHGIAMPRAKCSLYEPGLQVPLIVRLPSRKGWHGGVRRREMVSNVDHLPTWLEALGVPAPAAVQGRSFAALLDGRGYTPREAVFGEMTFHDYYDPRRSVRTERYKLIVNFSSAPAFMNPSQSWRPRSDTVVPPDPARAYHPLLELYDLQDDPWERVNLVGKESHAAVLGEMQALLSRHLHQTRDPILAGGVTSPMHRRAIMWLSPRG